jgi:hypothetical protein
MQISELSLPRARPFARFAPGCFSAPSADETPAPRLQLSLACEAARGKASYVLWRCAQRRKHTRGMQSKANRADKTADSHWTHPTIRNQSPDRAHFQERTRLLSAVQSLGLIGRPNVVGMLDSARMCPVSARQ